MSATPGTMRRIRALLVTLSHSAKGEWQASRIHQEASELLNRLPRKRPTKKLPKELQSTKPQRTAAHRMTTKEIRAACMERSGGACELGVACAVYGGNSNNLEWHHLEGGSGRRRQAQSVSNTLMACRACHRGYHHDPETFRFAVEEWAKAFNYPVPSRFRNAPLPRRGTA